MKEEREPAFNKLCVTLQSTIYMGGFSLDHPLVFSFGLLGNLISLLVFLAPIPTFYRICKKKSTEGFQPDPYVIALFSAMLWIYYALIKTDETLLISINSLGCVFQTTYVVLFFLYAPKKIKIYTVKFILILNVGVFASVILATLLLTKGAKRVQLLGWICVAFGVCVFAAPLSIIRQVIKTKSVEFLPFYLSFFLTMSAVVWFFYGLFTKDIFVAIPNVLGFAFGLAQMIIYIVYKDAKELKVIMEEKLPEHSVSVSASNKSETRVAPRGSDDNGEAGRKQVEINVDEGVEMSPV